ncbi:DegV family protein [Clostridium sp. 'deep sea']|uniref:DegV family protein n=1 Tax=Clostridium sp. 'deep sea' TaxID=2779445 RepID=UPI0018965985|nr:DegV family protein [Clostridium sp. 'deep sea']QOR34195.1 DegV family protein [Clostridium sp. 'deep sea']
MTIKILTDSTCYIPKNLLTEYNIDVVSLGIVFKNESFQETEITNSFFYSKLSNSKTLPTSSQPPINDIKSIFERNAKAGISTVAIFISSKMSGTYSTANMAKAMVLEKIPNAKIEIIDSLSNSLQLGFAVLAAAKEAKANGSLKDVVNAAKQNIIRSKFIFIPDNLEYLRKGGRIGAASSLIGSIMRIKPILTVREGTVKVLDKVRTKKRAVKSLVSIFLQDIKQFGLGDIKVHHIECEEEAKDLAKVIEDMIKLPVSIASIGPVIGTHVGPGAIGLVYYTKKPLINELKN